MKISELILLLKTAEPRLFILCGLPYSGKTYLSDRLRAVVPITYVCIDEILKDRGYDWDKSLLPDQKGWHQVFEESYERSREALMSGCSVLYDSTNHTKISRDMLRAIAAHAGVKARVLYIKVSSETIWRRWEEIRKTKQRSLIPHELVEKTIVAFEIPHEDEDYIEIEN